MRKSGREVKIKNIGGRNYAYDMISYWDKELKKYRKKSVYLGRVTNPATKEYRPKNTKSVEPEKCEKELIQKFGDSYAIVKTAEQSQFGGVLKSLPVNYETLMSLVCFKLTMSSAMQYAQVWSAGNYISTMFPNAELSSQRISDFLEEIGKESLWRKFFGEYIKCVTGEKTGIIADSTGMPNEIDIPITAWGNHGGDTQLETRLLMVIDKDTGKPLYFRYMAGNIVDVSTLKNTVSELSEFGVNTSYALLDAGYFSEANIKALYADSIAFLTRLTSGRKLYKELIETHKDVENAGNAVIYGERALFVKKVEVDLFGNKGYAYVVCDIRRKGDETTKYLIGAKDDGMSSEDIGKHLNEKGKFVLVSSEDVPVSEIIPMYYTRQTAEKLFGISKSFIDLLPLRTHKIETLRGYLMLTFIALLVHQELKSKLADKFTVERAIIEMGNLMCKVFGSKVQVQEPNKNMKKILDLLGFMVPMCSGV